MSILMMGTLSNHSDAEVAEQNFLLVSEQQIFWFNAPMDQLVLMA
jgi:hypothetical protein